MEQHAGKRTPGGGRGRGSEEGMPKWVFCPAVSRMPMLLLSRSELVVWQEEAALEKTRAEAGHTWGHMPRASTVLW